MNKISGSAVVLLSGGQDSTTVLFWARQRFSAVHAVTVHYGQTHTAELGAATEIAAMAGVASHVFVPLVDVFAGSLSALIMGSRAELRDRGGMADHAAPEGLPTSFVPARNLLLLSIGAARAGAVGAAAVCAGVCQTDYSGYPDCRETFVDAFAVALAQGWPSGHTSPSIAVPLMHMSKADTVRLAMSLPGCMTALAHSVTCYRGLRGGCGACAACDLRARGFREAGIVDPAITEWGRSA